MLDNPAQTVEYLEPMLFFRHHLTTLPTAASESDCDNFSLAETAKPLTSSAEPETKQIVCSRGRGQQFCQEFALTFRQQLPRSLLNRTDGPGTSPLFATAPGRKRSRHNICGAGCFY